MNARELLTAAHRFPLATLEERIGKGGLVVIAPHPDDESLACGGALAQASERGRPARVVVVSDGAGSHPASKAYPKNRLRDLREDEAKQAARELGLDPDRDVVFLRLSDRFVPSEGSEAEEAVGKILEVLDAVQAQALFVSWRHDPHCDHQASYRIARAVQRRAVHLRLYEYTVWGAALPPETPIGSIKGFRLSISQTLEKKRRAIAAHRSQTTRLIDDDPSGFCLTAADLARFDLPYECFFEGDP
jgi:LmbE family N-acetylglucosaminyl deacetylase